MAQIPQAIDYGQRPSLKSGRVDMPGQGDLAVGDAIAVAADTFANMMVDRKEKTDAFNYSMRKSEYMTADLANREKLKDDRDYETFDERYRGWMQNDGDRIAKSYPLPPEDEALFGAEAKLILETGAAGVQEWRRTVEIDDNLAKMDAALTIAAEEAILAPPGERNRILINGLDLINEAVKRLWLTDEQGENKRQVYGQDVALKSLKFMEPELRQKVIEESLRYRKALGPLTPDDIRAGKGTGSIADFLHTDTLNEMLEITKKENEIDQAQSEGFAARDQAWADNPGLGSDARKRRTQFYKDAGLSAEARTVAEAADARKVLVEETIRLEGWRETDDALRQLIRDGASYSELPGEMTESLPPPMQSATEGYAKRIRYSDGYADQVSDTATQVYRDMTPQQVAEFEAEGYFPDVQISEDRPDLKLLSVEKWQDHITREQADMWNAAAQQKREQLAANAPPPEPGLTLTQQLNAIFGLVMKQPTTSSDKKTWDKWNRMWLNYNNIVIQAGGDGKLTPAEKLKIATELTQFEVYERVKGFDKSGVNFATMSQEQIERGYLKLDEPVPPFGQTAHTMKIDYDADPELELPAFNGYAIEWLKQTGSAVNPVDEGTVPSDEVLTEAFFYLVTDGPAAALYRLKGLPGY